MSPAHDDAIRLVIVDDIPETVEHLRKLIDLDDLFVVVGTALNGEDGIRAVGLLKPDVVLMDVSMPGIDGFAAAEAIRSQEPRVAIVFASILGRDEHVERARRVGAVGYLVKPFTASELMAVLRRAASHPREMLVDGYDGEAKALPTARAATRPKPQRVGARVSAGDLAAPRCAVCGLSELDHSQGHAFEGRRWQHLRRRAETALAKPIVIGLLLGALYAFFWSATTPGAPFHSWTAPLLCFWDVKGQECS